jgi:hypothetical protein
MVAYKLASAAGTEVILFAVALFSVFDYSGTPATGTRDFYGY